MKKFFAIMILTSLMTVGFLYALSEPVFNELERKQLQEVIE